MAQLVERLVRNEEASGSNPLSSTKKEKTANAVFSFLVTLIVRTAVFSAGRASNVRNEKLNKRVNLVGVATLSSDGE